MLRGGHIVEGLLSATKWGRGRGPSRSDGKVRWSRYENDAAAWRPIAVEADGAPIPTPHPPRASAGPLPLPTRAPLLPLSRQNGLTRAERARSDVSPVAI